ncbi:MAG: hypothetical protein JEY96_04910 [Bacteroidales bacterium]|nr:hypothetical protein [Bacteroidales bacterium]
MKYHPIWKNLLLILIVIFLIDSCTSNKKTITNQHSNDTDIIEEAIKNNFNETDSVYSISNNEGNLVLYVAEKKEMVQNSININFFVYDKERNSIIYKNKYDRASIKWYNNNQLLLVRKLGIVDKQTGMNIKHYIIDIKSKKVTERILKPENNK